MATSHSITKPLSRFFQDAYLCAVFKAAEDDGFAPNLVEIDHAPVLRADPDDRPARLGGGLTSATTLGRQPRRKKL